MASYDVQEWRRLQCCYWTGRETHVRGTADDGCGERFFDYAQALFCAYATRGTGLPFVCAVVCDWLFDGPIALLRPMCWPVCFRHHYFGRELWQMQLCTLSLAARISNKIMRITTRGSLCTVLQAIGRLLPFIRQQDIAQLAISSFDHLLTTSRNPSIASPQSRRPALPSPAECSRHVLHMPITTDCTHTARCLALKSHVSDYIDDSSCDIFN